MGRKTGYCVLGKNRWRHSRGVRIQVGNEFVGYSVSVGSISSGMTSIEIHEGMEHYTKFQRLPPVSMSFVPGELPSTWTTSMP